MIVCDACRGARAWPRPSKITFGVCELCSAGPLKCFEAATFEPLVPVEAKRLEAPAPPPPPPPPTSSMDAMTAALAVVGVARDAVAVELVAAFALVFEAGRRAERAELAAWLKGRTP